MVKSDVPRPFDNIEVLFDVDETEPFWWPGIMLESEEHDDTGTVKGTGVIEYSARKKFPKCSSRVIFLANRTVATESGETPWRTSAEAADAGAGNAEDRDWENGNRGEPSKEGSAEEDCATACTTDGEQASPDPRRPEKRARTEIVQTPSGVCAGCKALRKTVEDLAFRTGKVENNLERAMDIRDASGSGKDKKLYNYLLVIWRRRVLEELARAIKDVVPKRGKQYKSSVPHGTLLVSAGVVSGALQPGCIRISDDLPYYLFANMVKDMTCNENFAGTERVTFIPSYEALINPTRDIKEGHVIFPTATFLLQWLGVTGTDDIVNAIFRTHKLRSNTEVTRVLGGVQNEVDNEDTPFRVFIARSCVAQPSENEADLQRDSRISIAAEYQTTRWDVSNNMMADRLCLKERRPGRVSTMEDARETTSVFSFSWEWSKGEEGKAFSKHARRLDFVRIGRMTINIPFVLFRGNQTSESLRSICTKKQVEMVVKN